MPLVAGNHPALAPLATAHGVPFEHIPVGPDYFLVNDAGGVPAGLRGDFIRDQGGRVRWLRLSGRLHRHRP